MEFFFGFSLILVSFGVSLAYETGPRKGTPTYLQISVSLFQSIET
jgi:hypothetical protein